MLLLALSTDNAGLTQVCKLAVDPWPEDITAGVSNGELRATISSMYLVQDSGTRRERKQ